ncbi:MAG: hypothetical protein ACM3MD_03650 [Betaproteobacteria bacterium]
MFTILIPMATDINESISVAVIFSRGMVKPVWFSWHGRRIRIQEISFTWKTREGSAPIFHFSVSDGQGLYELRYNTVNFLWRLAAVAERSAY